MKHTNHPYASYAPRQRANIAGERVCSSDHHTEY